MKPSVIVSRSLILGAFLLVGPVPIGALTVCADPDYLPYSNRSGEGFENKTATFVAKALNEPVQYVWRGYREHGGFPQFLAATLDAKKCDVVMSLPYGSREELTTRPYYISSYVFVFDKGKKYDITSMDSPALKQLRVGFERETPAEDGLKIRGLLPGSAVPFDIADDAGESPAVMLAALKDSRIDVLITWQPAVGLFLKNNPGYEVIPVPNSRTLGAPEQYSFPMSMGVRLGDEALKKRLDDIIENRQSELNAILAESGVMVHGR